MSSVQNWDPLMADWETGLAGAERPRQHLAGEVEECARLCCRNRTLRRVRAPAGAPPQLLRKGAQQRVDAHLILREGEARPGVLVRLRRALHVPLVIKGQE